MSKEEWEQDLAWEEEEKPAKVEEEEEEEDWENFDVDTLKDEEKEKERKKEEQRKKELEEKKKQEEQRKKIEAEKKRQRAGVTTEGGAPKQLSGMMQAYATQSADYDETLELFQGNQRPRIEILQPRDKKDFEEFADIIADKLLESSSNEHYIHFLKLLLEKSTDDLKADDLKELQKHMNTLVTKKQLQEKEAKKLPQAKKASKIAVKIAVDDPFADLANTSGGGTNYDDDEDFM